MLGRRCALEVRAGPTPDHVSATSPAHHTSHTRQHGTTLQLHRLQAAEPRCIDSLPGRQIGAQHPTDTRPQRQIHDTLKIQGPSRKSCVTRHLTGSLPVVSCSQQRRRHARLCVVAAPSLTSWHPVPFVPSRLSWSARWSDTAIWGRTYWACLTARPP